MTSIVRLGQSGEKTCRADMMAIYHVSAAAELSKSASRRLKRHGVRMEGLELVTQ